MDEDKQQAAAGAEPRRRRPSLRQRQVAAGLVEEWVREADARRAYALLEPLIEAGRQQFARHRRLGQGDAVAVEVRFSGVAPAALREQLRQEWAAGVRTPPGAGGECWAA